VARSTAATSTGAGGIKTRTADKIGWCRFGGIVQNRQSIWTKRRAAQSWRSARASAALRGGGRHRTPRMPLLRRHVACDRRDPHSSTLYPRSFGAGHASVALCLSDLRGHRQQSAARQVEVGAHDERGALSSAAGKPDTPKPIDGFFQLQAPDPPAPSLRSAATAPLALSRSTARLP
jgi:hypothetical protein